MGDILNGLGRMGPMAVRIARGLGFKYLIGKNKRRDWRLSSKK